MAGKVTQNSPILAYSLNFKAFAKELPFPCNKRVESPINLFDHYELMSCFQIDTRL